MRTHPQQDMKYLIIIVTATVLAFNPGTSIATDKENTPVVTSDKVQKIRRDAEQGVAEAQYNLGVMYDNGKGVPQSYTEAMKWYRLSAEQGDADAQYNLGVMHFAGQGVRQSYPEALKWFRLAASKGYASAQYNLGIMYYNGQGVRVNMAIAKEWLGKACDNGDQQGCDRYRELSLQGK